MASRHLWGERWLHWRPSSSKAPDRTARPAQNSLAPPHIHAHLNSRQDTFVNLPGESQVVRKNRDWINRPVSGPTLLTECSGTRMRNKGHAQQGVRAHTRTHCACSLRWACAVPVEVFPPLRQSPEPHGLWRMRKGLEEYIFFFPVQSFLCIHTLWW